MHGWNRGCPAVVTGGHSPKQPRSLERRCSAANAAKSHRVARSDWAQSQRKCTTHCFDMYDHSDRFLRLAKPVRKRGPLP